MPIHTDAGQVVEAVGSPGLVTIRVLCAEGVCEPIEIPLDAVQWLDLVAEGSAYLAGRS
jgi:hypothetical protein